MATSSKTPNYDLPQWASGDVTAWMGDLNPAFSAIDTAMHNNAQSASEAQTQASQAEETANTANQTATQVQQGLQTTNQNVTNLQGSVQTNTQNITSLQSQYSALNSAVQSLVDSNFQSQIQNIENNMPSDKLDVSVTGFTSDATYAQLPFRASLTWDSLTQNMIANASPSITNEYQGKILLSPQNGLMYIYTESDPGTLLFDWISVRTVNSNA